MTSKNWNCTTSSGAVYGIGLIGAAVYYLQSAATLWDGIVGLAKAIIWPGLLVYKVFDLLNL